MQRPLSTYPRNERNGAALAAALVALTATALMTVGILMISSSLARRNLHSVDNKSAFYIAEAGLSEAYFALSVGKSGQIGSPQTPALFGDGLFWVTSTAFTDGTVHISSTGMCGGSRVELGLVVARLESAVARQGFFSETSLIVDQGTLADSYDSRIGPYQGQVGQGTVNTRSRLGSNGNIAVLASPQAPTQIRVTSSRASEPRLRSIRRPRSRARTRRGPRPRSCRASMFRKWRACRPYSTPAHCPS